MSRPPIPPDSPLRKAVLKDYAEGKLTLDQIAKKHKVSVGSVNAWSFEAGLSRQKTRRKLTEVTWVKGPGGIWSGKKENGS